LAWYKIEAKGIEFGKITDDETGQLFHVKLDLLRRAQMTRADHGAKVRFAADPKAATGQGDPPVYSIKRA
jgi:hypothetical protein